MAIEDRRQRERTARRHLITAAARTLAESEGWDAVTTRRLSTEIEYSQPVLYKHFGSMEDIVEAVALEGFGELAETLRAARLRSAAPDDEVGRVAAAFSDFAANNPALYNAMFTRAEAHDQEKGDALDEGCGEPGFPVLSPGLAEGLGIERHHRGIAGQCDGVGGADPAENERGEGGKAGCLLPAVHAVRKYRNTAANRAEVMIAAVLASA
jgi:AcrR family transcriptional regulator